MHLRVFCLVVHSKYLAPIADRYKSGQENDRKCPRHLKARNNENLRD